MANSKEVPAEFCSPPDSLDLAWHEKPCLPGLYIRLGPPAGRTAAVDIIELDDELAGELGYVHPEGGFVLVSSMPRGYHWFGPIPWPSDLFPSR